jgi:hypothetical protein
MSNNMTTFMNDMFEVRKTYLDGCGASFGLLSSGSVAIHP